jgi:4-hydroxybenzoate polyprenyltransferase
MTTGLFNLLRFIRFSHTVFALPFALGAMLVAASGWPDWRLVGLILICLVAARTAAMAFNRVADWNFDVRNPRTSGRQHLASRLAGKLLVAAGVAVFWGATWWINPLCFALAPVAVVLVLGYSLTKRFTACAHAFLGLALAAAPMGAWAAVRGELWSAAPWVLAAGVMLWVAGFDVIYATQDTEFDRAAGLKSVPAWLGNARALRVAQALHGLAWVALGAFGWVAALRWPYAVAWGVIGAALVFEHRLASTGDLDRVNRAFFQANAVVSAVFLAGVAGSLMVG